MPRLSTLAGALALALAGTSVAQAQTFTNVISFGDSLSDAGNVAALNSLPAGNSFTTNPDPVTAQLVAAAFGYNQTNISALIPGSAGSNYAYGGACVQADGVSFNCVNSPDGLPFSLTNQLGFYLATQGGHADGNALYTVWGGANDIFTYATLAGGGHITASQAQQGTGLAALTEVGLISALQNAGAHYIVVFNLPDIGVTPQFKGTPAQSSISGLSFVFNQTLDGGLATLGDGIIPINVYALVNEVLADPGAYGFSNVTGIACGPGGPGVASSVACGPAGSGLPFTYAPGTNESYFFADGVHPTGAAHRLLSQAVEATIAAPGQVSLAGELPLQVYDDHSSVINGELFANRRADRSDGEARGYAHLQFGKQTFDAAANTGEMDLNQFTATFGADYMAGESVTLGGAVSFGNSNGTTGGAGLHSREVLASAYAAANLGSIGYIDAIASVGSNNIDVNRSIPLGPSLRVDSGTTTAKDIAFELGGGLAFGSDDFHHGPFVSVAWQKVTVDGYAEDNTDSTSMWFSEFERKSLVGRLGYQLQTTSGNFKPYLRVAYAQEDKDDVTQVQAGSNSMNGHFTMNGFAPSDHWAEADVGVSYAANDSTDLVFNYHGRFSDDTQSRDALTFEVRKRF